MASCITSKWSSSTTPQVRLTVTLDTASSDGDTAVLDWVLEYVAHGYAANTSVTKSYTATINGKTVASGKYDIDGKKSTHTIASGSTSIAKTTSVQTISFGLSFAFNLTWSDKYGGTKTAMGSISIPAKAKYTISYNANGGSGAPASGSKWHGTSITLSDTKPTRTGHTFKGWSTSASATTATYAAGATYANNANVTLYAVWQPIEYQVKYNANGGTGAPATQTKIYGVTLKLSSTKPSRTNYTFLGWATSASATTATYTSGANYTSNTAVTLYAVWKLAYVKPSITSITATRCSKNESGAYDDDDSGKYVRVKFTWKSTNANPSYNCIIKGSPDENGMFAIYSHVGYLTGTSGTRDEVIPDAMVDPYGTFTISIEISDGGGSFTRSYTLSSLTFPIDCLAGGKGVAFGKTAELRDVADFEFKINPGSGFINPILPKGIDLNEVSEPNTYVGLNISTGDPNYSNCPITTGTFTLDVKSSGNNGQVWQRLTLCDKTISATYERFYYGSAWGEWVRTSDFGGKLLWQGVYYMSASQTATLSEPVSMQKTGIVLVFSRYSSGTAQNYHFNHAFVHKAFVKTHPGVGNTFMMTTDGSFSVMATKYLYIHDDRIDGNDINEATGTGDSGITYKNNGFVLRYVIGV